MENNTEIRYPHFVPKGWGWENWIVNKKEYCGKILFVKRGKRCSLHYHKIKDEVFYIQSGTVLLEIQTEPEYLDEYRLTAGDSFHIPTGLTHRFTGLTDAYIVEFSTEHFDEDSYRLVKGD